MHEDLQSLANLRIAKLTEYSTHETLPALRDITTKAAANGSLLTGRTEQAKFDIRADALTKISRGIADIWLELITKRNRYLTREDLTFIMQMVEGFALTQAKGLGDAMTNVPGGPVVTGGPGRNWWMEQADARMRRVAGDIRRDLEIKFQEQQAFPLAAAQEVSPMSGPVQVHIHNANISNLNLGTQVGTINAALQVLSTEGKSHQALADAIRQLTEATISDARLPASQKHEVVEALASIAKNAESGEGKPTLVTKALISWLPTVLGLSADAITLWDKFGPTVRAFFKL